MKPRPYQIAAVDACKAAHRGGARAVLLVVPTGGGKTVIGSLVTEGAIAKGRRVLWLAPRRELVDQAAARMPVRAGILMAGRKPDPSALIQVGSVDTIASRGEMPPADLVVYDEAHHVVAATSRAILAAYPLAHVLGLTATPARSDGTALGDVFQQMVQGPTVRELIDESHLVESDVIGPADESDALAADPVEAWERHAGGRPGFLFARTVEASKDYAARLTAAGIPAAHVDGGTAKGVRDKAIDAFRCGRIDVLSSVQVFTEGVDVPRAAVCMLARGCGHAGTYLQMVGRVLRPHPGKARALLIDLVGAVHKHGLPDDPREWSLTGKPFRQAERLPPLAQCPDCGAVWRPTAARECPRCKWQMPVPEAPPVEERPLEDLRERLRGVLRPAADETAKAAALARLRATAAERGYALGWVGMRFKSQFGHWPDSRRERRGERT